MEMLRNDLLRHAYYQQWTERRADELDSKNPIFRGDIEGLKTEHEVEIEQLHDQVDDPREHIDHLAEMIPNKPDKDPEEETVN
ncbi:UNVERIFIED_CONTAM: hypothetical protein Sradi_2337100 [Sesamum radiatum]|uniref:Uncharacterized protein n=1 Tax=Sesamum radiatum TaxID=300843 RepID=A0AAW2T5T8_SESRA